MAGPKNAWLEGRKVRLGRQIETRGGTVFPVGIVCLVERVYRGELTLKAKNPDPLNIFGPRYIFVRCGLEWHMEVLPDDRPYCPWKCGHLASVHHEKTEGCEGRCRCTWFPGTTELDPDLESERGQDAAFDVYDRHEDKPTKAEKTKPEDAKPLPDTTHPDDLE